MLKNHTARVHALWSYPLHEFKMKALQLPSGESRLSSHRKVFMPPSFWVQVTNWSEEEPECVPAKNVSAYCETTSRKVIVLRELNQFRTATGFSVQYHSQGWGSATSCSTTNFRKHSYHIWDCFCSFWRGRSTYLPPKQPPSCNV